MNHTDSALEILIIEDDKDIRETVRILLEGEGYTITEAADGAEGIQKLTKDTGLVILDVMLPGKSGYEACAEIRRFSYVPILFLTAKSRETDMLLGFQAGGDDYLVKPFSFSELSARVKALLRRYGTYNPLAFGKDSELPLSEAKWLTCDGLKVNPSLNQAMLGNSPVSLTETEYEILRLLMQYPDRVFSIRDIYEGIWNEPFLHSCSNSIMVHIRNLRTKIESDPQSPKYILTVWGRGYRFGKH